MTGADAGPAGPDRFRRRLGLIFAALLLPLTLSIHSLTSSGAIALADWMPEEALLVDTPTRSTVLARDGSVLATFYEQDRIEVELGEVSQAAKDAVLAVEDSRFYEHGAIDPVAMLRAAAANATAGSVREGGSTLTQQYVKQALVHEAADAQGRAAATEISLSRKVRELGHALALEADLTKDQILARYLNIVYFGNGAWGIQVAAQRYFGVSAKDLNVGQAALLAGLIKGPTAYDPLARPEAAAARRDLVLDRMVQVGVLDPAVAAAHRGTDLALSPTRTPQGCTAASHPFFCDYVLAEVRAMPALGTTPAERTARLLRGGLTVRTTLDPAIQRAATQAVRSRVRPDQAHGAAIVMTEPGTGAVRAVALSREYGKGPGRTEVNWALDAAQSGSHGFQAGSTFKAFVLAAAAAEGLDPDERHRAPASATFDDFRRCGGSEKFPPYTVRNYDGASHGRIDAAKATARSVNTWFVGLHERVGLCEAPELAERMGLRRADGEPLSRVPSFVLGVDEVSPLRMAEAYATLAARGEHCASHAIASIADASGRDLPGIGPQCRQVMSPDRADVVADILRGVVDGPDRRRTGAAMTLGSVRAAGKTGTTNSATAVWFVGFTDTLAAAVWAGHPDSTRPLRDVEVAGRHYDRLTGGALPGPIWAEAMAAALDLPADPEQRRAAVPPELLEAAETAQPQPEPAWDAEFGYWFGDEPDDYYADTHESDRRGRDSKERGSDDRDSKGRNSDDRNSDDRNSDDRNSDDRDSDDRDSDDRDSDDWVVEDEDSDDWWWEDGF